MAKLALLLVLLAPLRLPAQEETAAEAEVNPSASQEVEVSEDNYRRFMELKDQEVERGPMPIVSYAPQAGLEKMEQLPEASQKHLRNQLREIIMQGDAWQPQDQGGDYPYVPSAQAGKDIELRGQEAEAWAELVGEYHAREAAIYANATAGDPMAGQPAGQAGGGAAQQSASRQSPGEQSPGEQSPGQQSPGQQSASQTQTQAGENVAQTAAGDGSQSAQSAASESVSAAARKAQEASEEVTEKGVTESALQYLLLKCEEDHGEDRNSDCPEEDN